MGTKLNVVDNCGAKKVYCIKVMKGFKKRYAFLGDIILVAVKSIRKRRRKLVKVKTGEIYRALIVRTKSKTSFLSSDQFFFHENSVILFNKQNKIIGTRIFGGLPITLRYTKYLRILFLSNGIFY